MSSDYPAAGAFLHPNQSCTFTVWSPFRKKASVLLNDRTYPMEQDKYGYYTTTIPQVQEGDRYRFALEDDTPLPDPASRWQPEGVHGPSAVTSTSFNWTDDHWKGLSMADMVIYELHTGTFTPSGDFNGIVAKLDYLKELGITAIELMPVAAFPGWRNWGYDGVFPFAVQDSYGGVQGLKQLVNEAHQRGIAVILDVVYNHMGPEGNYLGQYGPYFTDKYRINWGNAVNFDDAYSYGVRSFFWQNALMWLDEFHIDALRLDAVHAIWDFSAPHFLAVLKDKVTALEETTGRQKVLIAEFDLNNPLYITPRASNGLGLTGQWCDEFHHALHALVTGEVNGYYEDFGATWHLAKSLEDSYVYTGQFSVHRKKNFGVKPVETTYDQFVVFAQNHDQVGNRLLGDRLTAKLSPEALKLAAAAVLLSPHVPMLFMGEEYGETHPFQYFISHEDEDLVNMVRKGRREEFSYFNWEGEIPDPQAVETFEQCKLSWNQETDKQAAMLLAYYKYLLRFRKERKAMRGLKRDQLQLIKPDLPGIIGFERNNDGDRLLIFLNFNPHEAHCSPDIPERAKKVFDSSDKTWNGPGGNSFTPGELMLMNPQSAIIFEIA